MIGAWIGDVKRLAWQTWRSPALPFAVVVFGVAMLAHNARTTAAADGMKTMMLLRHAQVISTLKRRGDYRCEWIDAIKLPNLSNPNSEAIFGWTASISSEGSALDVTLILPGYEGHFSTANFDSMA